MSSPVNVQEISAPPVFAGRSSFSVLLCPDPVLSNARAYAQVVSTVKPLAHKLGHWRALDLDIGAPRTTNVQRRQEERKYIEH
ncbi:hypothetical protein Ddc_14473 [Ditylenchus destructor]|nr:hypothetical protein Ddc_14473 [Ditylenchus destructor]